MTYKSHNKNGKKGFTLVEVLAVIFITTIISGIMVVGFRQGAKSNQLQRSAQQIVQNIRKAQNMALSSAEFQNDVPLGGYGIRFKKPTPTVYILFADKNGNVVYDEGEMVQSFDLESGVEIIFLLADDKEKQVIDIVFVPPDPVTKFSIEEANIVTATIRKQNGSCPQDCRYIIISDKGWISIKKTP